MTAAESENFLYCPYCGAGQSIDEIEFSPGEYTLVCPSCLEEFSYEVRLKFSAFRKADEGNLHS